MLRKPADFQLDTFYLSMLQKPAAGHHNPPRRPRDKTFYTVHPSQNSYILFCSNGLAVCEILHIYLK